MLACSDSVSGSSANVWAEKLCAPASPATGANHILLHEDVECESTDEINFGTQTTVEACAQRCRDQAGCKYFLFGVPG